MAAGSRWTLAGFGHRIENLGTLSESAQAALERLLVALERDPVRVSNARLMTGRHLGQSADEREAPFPPFFRSRVPAGPAGYLTCAYFVDPDARTVTCVELEFDRGR